MKVGPPIDSLPDLVHHLDGVGGVHRRDVPASGWPAANIPAMFFFQRVWIRRLTEPGGLNVVLRRTASARADVVLAYDSVSYIG
jgi:hypothetical protein